jgi:hypothetical protein
MKKKLPNTSKKKYIEIIDGKEVVFKSFETYLINKFISNKDSVNYPREIKIAKQLGELSRDQEFWNYIPQCKVDSLCFFIKKDNFNIIKYHHDEYVKERWKKFQESKRKNLDLPKSSITLSEEKVGEDVVIKKPLLSLKDFILYG